MKRTTYKTNAAFRLPGKDNWTWRTWTHSTPSKHAAILEKAIELGAVSWDFGQATHAELSRYPRTRG